MCPPAWRTTTDQFCQRPPSTGRRKNIVASHRSRQPDAAEIPGQRVDSIPMRSAGSLSRGIEKRSKACACRLRQYRGPVRTLPQGPGCRSPRESTLSHCAHCAHCARSAGQLGMLDPGSSDRRPGRGYRFPAGCLLDGNPKEDGAGRCGITLAKRVGDQGAYVLEGFFPGLSLGR